MFEVDHPDTQKIKIEKFREIFQPLPDHVTYVPLALFTGSLGAVLYQNGYDSRMKTLGFLPHI
jgi:O-methyltransferase involved in polyketide biosynthesis